MLLPVETNEAYHKRTELSSSDIKWMIESPYHFKKMVVEKESLVREPNSAFDIGTCAHECFLEQDTSRFVALPEGLDRRTKEGKEIYATFMTENEGKRVITNDQLQTILAMFDVISSNKLASELVSNSQVEVGAVYKDDATGLMCKFRPDILNLEKGYIADYKTCFAASPHEFSKAVARYFYHLSAAHYMAGASQLWPGAIKDYFFICQEKTYPFAVAVYKLDPTDIFKSFDLRTKILKKIDYCFKNDQWPDWSREPMPLSIPGYAYSFSEDC